MDNNLKKFADTISPYIYSATREKGFPEYICGIVIAQAWHQSCECTSILATKYFNYFNIKNGASWKGDSARLLKDGLAKEVKAGLFNRNDFRAYKDVKEGIEGYFDFIDCPRYANIKKSMSGHDYLRKLEADGYILGSFKEVYRIYKDNHLEDYNYEKNAKPVIAKPPVKNTTVAKAPVEQPKEIKKPVENKKKVDNKPTYYKACNPNTSSIITALLEVGCQDTSQEYRLKLANVNGISASGPYNVKLLELLKQGKLRRV